MIMALYNAITPAMLANPTANAAAIATLGSTYVASNSFKEIKETLALRTKMRRHVNDVINAQWSALTASNGVKWRKKY